MNPAPAALCVTIALTLPILASPAADIAQIEVQTGENAFQLQARSGFPMGYPTRPDGLSPIGGRARVGDVRLRIGPIDLRCRNALLALSRGADLVVGGAIYCPLDDPDAQIAAVAGTITAAMDWKEYRDHLASPRRATEYGDSIPDALNYLGNDAPLVGTIIRVPLYSWLSDQGLYLDMNMARHQALGYAITYEVKFSWLPPCLPTGPDDPGTDDESRAADMARRLPEICPDLPPNLLPDGRAGAPQ